MTTHQPHDDRLPGEENVARRYRNIGHEQPSPALDARILAAAGAVRATPRMRRGFGLRWAVPLSTAAVIVFSVVVVLLMTEEGALNHREPAVPFVAEAPPAASGSSAVGSAREAAPAKAERPAATAPSRHMSDALESKRVLAEAMPEQALRVKEAEAPAAPRATSGPPARERMAPGVATMNDKADVVAVQVSGSPGAYQFNVTVRSPDRGCNQYADWWEVVSEDGRLLYRRVLLHSHVDEQPFSRSGGPVPVDAGAVVWVRAHMSTGGYGGVAFKGSVQAGFAATPLAATFARDLARQPPLPDGCDF